MYVCMRCTWQNVALYLQVEVFIAITLFV